MTDAPPSVTRWFDDRRRDTRGSHPFLVTPAGTLTYGELFDELHRLATVFAAAGLTEGDRAVLGSRDDRAATVLYLALLRCGLTVVVANPEAPAAELRALVEAAEPQGVLLDVEALAEATRGAPFEAGPWTLGIRSSAKRKKGGLRQLLKRKGPTTSEPDTTPTYPQLLADTAPAATLPELRDPKAVAVLLFTSGTTSRPKGVEIPRSALEAQIGVFLEHYGYDASSRILNHLPYHHTDGLCHGPTATLAAGATLHRPGPFRVQALPDILDSIHRDRITHFITVPTVLSMIQRFGHEFDDSFDTPDFRFVRSSAGALDPSLWAQFEERFHVRVVNAYGLTECVCESLYCGPDDGTYERGTLGRAIGCETRIVDEAGRDVAPGESGELWLGGPQVMSGYFRDPAGTADVLVDGWLRTGDLFRVDERGIFHLTGRKKTLIISGGTNVHPEEVTTVVRSCQGVEDAVTFGLPDPTWGERVVTCFVRAPQSSLSAEELTEHCRRHLAREKVPAELVMLPDLPRGPAGKVLLEEVKQRVRQRNAIADVVGDTDVAERVLRIAAACFKVSIDDLSAASTPETTRGWDSFAHMELVSALEGAFQIAFEPREIMSLSSLGEVERLLEARRRAA